MAAYATREKALLDLLYLYPFYCDEVQLADLRLDPDVLQDEFDRDAWRALGARFGCQALARRMRLLEEVYRL